jgi:hypothetical protein
VFVFRVAILRNPANLSKIPFTIFSFDKIKTCGKSLFTAFFK